VEKGLLHFNTVRPTSLGLEAHLSSIHSVISETNPSIVVIDPITNLVGVTGAPGVRSMLTRLIDFLKVKGITAMFTHLSSAGVSRSMEAADEGMSSLMDACLLLRDTEQDGKRNYGIFVLKARGMAHSHEIRQFSLSDSGICIGDVIRTNVASSVGAA
jgi:circadian clock protein KaiC